MKRLQYKHCKIAFRWFGEEEISVRDKIHEYVYGFEERTGHRPSRLSIGRKILGNFLSGLAHDYYTIVNLQEGILVDGRRTYKQGI